MRTTYLTSAQIEAVRDLITDENLKETNGITCDRIAVIDPNDGSVIIVISPEWVYRPKRGKIATDGKNYLWSKGKPLWSRGRVSGVGWEERRSKCPPISLDDGEVINTWYQEC